MAGKVNLLDVRYYGEEIYYWNAEQRDGNVECWHVNEEDAKIRRDRGSSRRL